MNKPRVVFLSPFFLQLTRSEIPEMFQITHRQNRAVKTQTGEGLPVPVSRSEGSTARPTKYCSQPGPPFPTNSKLYICFLTHL